ncbi:hypothetical protein H5410_056177 [Solanum commersonii]|uniref:Uncharacterized protein n=1 Tax=Solanum commersonii TaxID=4109 RepID=A0A9J5WJJ3_SOLCO|nr:hypothetical protein H5410_056177 [Solanum commersonii]
MGRFKQLEWKIDESPEYHPEPYYDGDDDGDDAPTWQYVIFLFRNSLLKVLYGLSLLPTSSKKRFYIRTRFECRQIGYVDLCRLANWLTHDTTFDQKER